LVFFLLFIHGLPNNYAKRGCCGMMASVGIQRPQDFGFSAAHFIRVECLERSVTSKPAAHRLQSFASIPLAGTQNSQDEEQELPTKLPRSHGSPPTLHKHASPKDDATLSMRTLLDMLSLCRHGLISQWRRRFSYSSLQTPFSLRCRPSFGTAHFRHGTFSSQFMRYGPACPRGSSLPFGQALVAALFGAVDVKLETGTKGRVVKQECRSQKISINHLGPWHSDLLLGS